jgi:5'-3' exonuclease
VGATVGLVQTVLGLLAAPEVTHLAVATDHVIESFRNDLFPGYKSSEGVDPDLLAQFELAEQALASLGVVVWPMVEFEADDAIATAANRFAPETRQVRILSPDKDFAQCVEGDRVVAVDRRRGRILDEPGVVARFGVAPESIPDYLALVGDKADGIPGLPGWGAKTASRVLARHPHLEDIPRDLDWVPARLLETLFDRWEEVVLYRELATLRRDVPLEEDLDALEWRGVPRDRFLDMCDRLGVRGLRNRPRRWAAT